MKTNLKTSYLILTLITLFLFSGCGGGGGGSTVVPVVSSAPSIVSGSVIDGYLSGATVCIDAVNKNGNCDSGETTTTTLADGTFRFSDLSLSRNTLIPLIVSGGTDIATSKSFEGEYKTIINTGDLEDTSLTYISPITDLIANSYLQGTTQNEESLNTIKQNIATSLGLTVEQLDSDPLSDIEVYVKAQQIEQFKKIVRISLEKSLNRELTATDNLNLSRAIAQELQASGSFNISNILTRIETNLLTPIPANEKTFIEAQLNTINTRLNDLATNYTPTSINLNHFQKALEQELEDVKVTISESPDTTSVISTINISPVATLATNGAAIQLNRVPTFTTIIDTLAIEENTILNTIVEAEDLDNDTITYSLGGIDSNYFTINSSNGAITSTQIFDYEVPDDVGANNTYNLIVIASDGKEKSFFDLEVNITNVDETTTLPLQIDGFVVDGYIGGATVCIDTNVNGTCDTDETSTTTLNDGSFRFTDVTFDLNKLIPLIVTGGTDTATGSAFEGEIKTIINTNSLNDINTIYVSPITDLYATSFFESITNDEESLQNTKDTIATVLALNVNILDTNTLENLPLFEESIKLQSMIYILQEVSQSELNRTLTDTEVKRIKESIIKEMEENSAMNITRILTTVEIQLGLNLSANERTFVEAQFNEAKSTLDNISVNSILNSTNTADLKDAFFAQLQDIIVPLKETTLSVVPISTIDDLLTLSTTIKGNNPPVFTITETTVTDVENKEFKYLITATDADDDPVTFNVLGIDKSYFTMDTENNITSTNIPSTYFDYEEPLDSGQNNIYNILIEASDGKEKSYHVFDIEITDVDENAPIFNIPNVIEIEEQQDYVIQADAFDENTLTYYLSDSDDGLRFFIDESTGIIRHRTSDNNGVKISLPDIDDTRRLYVINAYASDEQDNTTEHILNIRIKQKPRTAIIDNVNLLDDYAINGNTFYIPDGSTGTDICRTITARGTLESDTNTIVEDPKAAIPTYINADTTLERFTAMIGDDDDDTNNTIYTPPQTISSIGSAGNSGTATLCLPVVVADKNEQEIYVYTAIVYTKDLTTDLIYQNRKTYYFVIID